MELRKKTGIGMMECKKALVEAEGDFDKAIEWLREKGLAAQTKKAGKVAAEGVSYAILIMNCCVGFFDRIGVPKRFGAVRQKKQKKGGAEA